MLLNFLKTIFEYLKFFRIYMHIIIAKYAQLLLINIEENEILKTAIAVLFTFENVLCNHSNSHQLTFQAFLYIYI